MLVMLINSMSNKLYVSIESLIKNYVLGIF